MNRVLLPLALLAATLGCGSPGMQTGPTDAESVEREPTCRSFPSEFLELHPTSTQHHSCSFNRERIEYSCKVDYSYRYADLYRSVEDFVAEGEVVGLPRFTAINYTVGDTLMLQEQMNYSDKGQLVNRTVRDPNAKRNVIVENIEAWDSLNRPTRGRANFDYGAGDTCIGHELTFTYNDEARQVTKIYQGAEGFNCDTTTLTFQFDGDGNLRLQLLSWHGGEARKIRRGDILEIREVCN